MSTLTELKNDARQALTKAIAARDAGEMDAYKGFWTEYETAISTYDTQEADEAKTKAAMDRFSALDQRNPEDALIKTLPADEAKQGVQLSDGSVVQYADKNTEGWIKGFPESCQLPEIVRRLKPADREKAQAQSAAFVKYVRKGLSFLDANERKALQENTDSEGGYLVPTDQVRLPVIRDPGAPGGVTRAISSVFQTSRDSGDFPTAGSVLWAVVAEEGAIPATTDPVFGQVTFAIKKVMGSHKVSTELLEDSVVNIPALLGDLYSESLGRYEDQQAIEGDGTTEPEGLRVASVTDSVDPTAIATAPLALDVIAHYFDLPAQFRANGTWHTSSTWMAKVVSINPTNGMRMVEFLGDPIRPVILGRPVVMFDGTGWDSAAAVAANEEFGAFGDFRNYYFIDRVGMSIKRLDELYAGNDQIGFVARKRFDGRVALTNAFRIIKAAAA